MAGISLSLSGSLLSSRAADCPPGTTDAPCSFNLALLSQNMSFQGGSEISQQEMTVNTPSPGFTSLAFPSNLGGRVFYLRPLSGSFTAVELTHATAGAIVYPVNGMILVEVPEAEQISAVRVQGQGTFEWICAGVLT